MERSERLERRPTTWREGSEGLAAPSGLNGRAIAARRQTMTFPIIYALARNCVVSPLNVRTESDPDAAAELEAMIGQAGFIIQNLIGTAVKRAEERRGGKGGVSPCRCRWWP